MFDLTLYLVYIGYYKSSTHTNKGATMKKVYIPDTKTCDICNKENATYDAPTVYNNKWANMCADCFIDVSAPSATTVGYKLVVGEKPEVDESERIAAIHAAAQDFDVETLYELIGDGDLADYL